MFFGNRVLLQQIFSVLAFLFVVDKVEGLGDRI